MAVSRTKGVMPVEDRRAIANAWLERTAQTYPPQAAATLLSREDRFSNPAGHAFREGLPILLDLVLGEAEAGAARKVLDELLSIRAVQDFTAAQAVSFVFLLKPLLREYSGRDERIGDKIDELALMAFDAFTQCRERLLNLQVNEARRRTFVLERMLES